MENFSIVVESSFKKVRLYKEIIIILMLKYFNIMIFESEWEHLLTIYSHQKIQTLK